MCLTIDVKQTQSLFHNQQQQADHKIYTYTSTTLQQQLPPTHTQAPTHTMFMYVFTALSQAHNLLKLKLNSIYINSSSSNLFMDGWWNDKMDRHEKRKRERKGKSLLQRWIIFFSSFFSLSLAIWCHLLVLITLSKQINITSSMREEKNTFLRNKWTSRFIKFMSIFTLSIYPSIHLIQFRFIEKKENGI